MIERFPKPFQRWFQPRPTNALIVELRTFRVVGLFALVVSAWFVFLVVDLLAYLMLRGLRAGISESHLLITMTLGVTAGLIAGMWGARSYWRFLITQVLIRDVTVPWWRRLFRSLRHTALQPVHWVILLWPVASVVALLLARRWFGNSSLFFLFLLFNGSLVAMLPGFSIGLFRYSNWTITACVARAREIRL